MSDEVGKRKKKKKPVDVVVTPELPSYRYGSPPKCSCLGGHCWKPCKEKRKPSNLRKKGGKKKDQPDIRTWHPDKDKRVRNVNGG